MLSSKLRTFYQTFSTFVHRQIGIMVVAGKEFYSVYSLYYRQTNYMNIYNFNYIFYDMGYYKTRELFHGATTK